MDMSEELLYFYKEIKAVAGVNQYRFGYFSRMNWCRILSIKQGVKVLLEMVYII